ncbi:MAG: flagellin [Alphaproteobacteria bacterium]|nr:flagellin [Alphaproteobacteria bacterium]
MSSDVVLTAALRSNLLSLQNTQRLIDSTQLRLATGLKVNSALDNPQNFFSAQSLNNRANDLSRLLDGIGQSIRTIEEANTGVTALSNLVNQAESVAIEAQSEIRAAEGFARIRGTEDLSGITDLTNINGGGTIVDGTSDSFDLTVVESDGTTSGPLTIDIAAGDTVDSIVAAINSDATVNDVVRASVTSGGQLQIQSLEEDAVIRLEASAANGLTAAGFAALGLDTVVSSEDIAGGLNQQGGTAIAGNILRSGIAANTAASGEYEASQLLDGSANGAGYITAAGDVDLSITIDGVTTSLGEVSDTDTVQDVLDRINNSGVDDLTATFDTETGQIELEFDSNVGSVELQFGSTAGATTNFGFGTGEADQAIAAGEFASENFTFVGTSVDLDQFESDFNNIRDQIDQLVEDANYRGVNLLAGDDLETFFNEDRDNTLVTEGVDFTSLGLGIDEGDFTTAADIQLSIDDVRSALSSVRAFGQSIANDLNIIQTRRDFTESTINTLQAGADDLTVADQNEEGANLLALQTRQQLGVTSLSLAAQSQQSVLALF